MRKVPDGLTPHRDGLATCSVAGWVAQLGPRDRPEVAQVLSAVPGSILIVPQTILSRGPSTLPLERARYRYDLVLHNFAQRLGVRCWGGDRVSALRTGRRRPT